MATLHIYSINLQNTIIPLYIEWFLSFIFIFFPQMSLFNSDAVVVLYVSL